MTELVVNRAPARKLPPISHNENNVKESVRRVDKGTKKRRQGSASRPRLEENGVQPTQPIVLQKSKKKNLGPKTEDLNDKTGSPLDEEVVDTRSKKSGRRKKKLGSQEQLVAEEKVADVPETGMSISGNRPKKRCKKKGAKRDEENEPDIGLEAELGDLQEDVVVSGAFMVTSPTHLNPPAMRSEPANKLFIEQRSGFKIADKLKIARQRAEIDGQMTGVPVGTSAQTTIQFALSSQKIFKTISVFFQGLFAGFALWQIVQTYTLSNQSTDDFLVNYFFLAWPVQSMYYFLFILSAVSAFDRYDISRPTSSCALKAITLQSGAVSCFLYFIGLVFSVSIAATDQKISLYKSDSTLWENPIQAASEINTWRILNLVRGLMAILGWLVASTRPRMDQLTENLQKSDENILGVEPTTVDLVRSSGV